MDRILKEVASVKELAEKLDKIEKIKKLDSNGEVEAWRIAHSFSDLEESFSKFNNELLPGLISAQTEEEMKDILLDIGDEFRHMLYHIQDPETYSHLRGPVERGD